MLLKQTKTSKRLISFLLAAVLIFGAVSVSVYAVTDAEKEQYQKEMDKLNAEIKENEKKIEELKKEASQYDDDIAAYQEKIDVLQEQIDLYDDAIALIDKAIAVIDDQIKAIENEIDSLNKEIEKLDEQVIEVQQEIADTYTLLGERIRASYMSGANSTLEYLLTNDDFEFQSYLERVELLERIAEHDDKLIKSLEKDIENLNKKVEEIKEKQKLLDTKIGELDEVKKEHEAKKQKQVDARKVIEDAENEILVDLNKIKSIVNKLDAQSAEYQKAIDKREDAIAEYERKLAAENTSFGSGTVSGDMIWPLPYDNTYVSSSFKMRTLNGVTKQHNGIDICRWSGTSNQNVVAVKEGTVTTARKYDGGGYGKYVTIDHGNGVVSYYAHLNQVNVNVGDYVTQGTLLGLSGNTGYSFGAHLHFGLMINGGWVNPMNYLTKPAGLQIVA